MALTNGGTSDSSRTDQRSIFISYRRTDDSPPPEDLTAEGFVQYFHKQLQYELEDQLGLPKGVLWRDRCKLAAGDVFTKVIEDALGRSDIFLAILSRNYIQSDWCDREVTCFWKHFKDLDADARRRRIFRIDKHEIEDRDLPEPLREIHAIRFFEKNAETGLEEQFYYRGKLRQRDPFFAAIREVATAIFQRLRELGVEPKPRRAAVEAPVVASNGRTIYLAKPGSDLQAAYRTLVRELAGRGYGVVPDPQQELPNDGPAAVEAIARALAQADTAIHLLGERRGFQPDGARDGIVPLQLAEAGRQATARAGFERLIWAPKIMPGAAPDSAPRDPLAVLQQFDQLLPSDQIEGDTESRFDEFVLQRLGGREAPAAVTKKRYAYIGALPVDQKLVVEFGRRFKEFGLSLILGPADPSTLKRADRVIWCWGEADEASMVDALESPALQGWRAANPAARIILLACPPASDSKATACQLDTFGAADFVLDVTATDFGGRLASLVAAA